MKRVRLSVVRGARIVASFGAGVEAKKATKYATWRAPMRRGAYRSSCRPWDSRHQASEVSLRGRPRPLTRREAPDSARWTGIH